MHKTINELITTIYKSPSLSDVLIDCGSGPS